MPTPDFSVVIPCYNYARYLRQSVESVVRQRAASFEVIVVDDCSTDESSLVASDLAAEFGVRTYTNPTNLGLVGTLNVGLGLSTGSYVICLSADDFLAPDALARQARAYEAHRSVGMVFGSYLRYKDGDERPSAEEYVSPSTTRSGRVYTHDGRKWFGRRCHVGNNPIGAAAVSIRRTVAERVGPYDVRCRHTSDLNMWLRAAAAADVGYLSGPPVAYYRKHPVSMSSVQFGTNSVDIRERWVAYDSAIASIGHGDLLDTWRRRVRHTLAEEALLRARAFQELGNSDEFASLMDVVAELDTSGSLAAARRTDAAGRLSSLTTRRLRRRLRLRWRREMLNRFGW